MDHIGTLRRAYDLINAHDIDAFGELLADDFVEHEELPGRGADREGVKDFFRVQIAAFPDLAMTVEDVVDGGDKVVARVRFTGTHDGDFMGMPPTGRAVDVAGDRHHALRGRRPRARALGCVRRDGDDAAARRGAPLRVARGPRVGTPA